MLVFKGGEVLVSLECLHRSHGLFLLPIWLAVTLRARFLVLTLEGLSAWESCT